MSYREQVDLIYMRDKGSRRSIRMRRAYFIALAVFFALLPFVCALLAWKCASLWERNRSLAENVERFEAEARHAAAKAEKLQFLEELLDETSLPAREIILGRLADSGERESAAPEETPPKEMSEGPGHEEFGIVNNGAVKVDNVHIRRINGNRLRIGLDLSNPAPEKLLSGEVGATLVTAGGDEIPLLFNPPGAGAFKINRFKRAALISRAGRNIDLADGQVILEVKDASDSLLFRNIYPIQR